jgi:hypothetical protein
VALVVSHLSPPVQGHWILVVLVAVLGGGCGGSGEPQFRDSSAEVGDAGTDGKADARATCPTPRQAPGFAQDVKPFLDAYCNVCHSTHPRDGGFAPPAQNFETYAGFRPWATESLVSMRRGGMPPPDSDPALSPADLCMFEAWIDRGAEDN